MISERDWIWQGHAGHFCAARNCFFRMATRVGNVLVSTVGEYYLNETSARLLGHEPPYQEQIGYSPSNDAFFETYVFRVHPTELLACGCAKVDDWNEVEGVRSATAQEATAQHMATCRKYAEQDGQVIQ